MHHTHTLPHEPDMKLSLLSFSMLLVVRLAASFFFLSPSIERVAHAQGLPSPFAQLPLAVAQSFTTMNYTQYSDADCKTVKNSSECGGTFCG